MRVWVQVCNQRPAIALTLSQVAAAIEKILIGSLQTVAQRRLRGPPQGGKLGTVEQLARRTIGPRSIEHQFPAKSDDFCDEPGKFPNTDFFAGSNIDEAVRRIMLHDKDA